MDTDMENGTCIVDVDDTIVWASPSFIELFAHRASPAGMTMRQLFPGMTDACRHGELLEDRDKLGRRRFFRPAYESVTNAKGDHVSDIIVLRNATLEKTLSDISRLSTQTKTPKELLEKSLWLAKDTFGYMGMAGFIARDGEIELLASKGWTEKLKSMISVVPVAPDSPSMAGRAAYHRQQLVTTIEEYGLMSTVKDAIARIGGEYVVATPLIDQEQVVGVLTVLHGRTLSPDELDTLQAICSQIAVALNVRATEEATTSRAEQASLYVELLAHEITAHNRIIQKWLAARQSPGVKVPEDVLWAIRRNDEAAEIINTACNAGNMAFKSAPLKEQVKLSIDDAVTMSRLHGHKLNVSCKTVPPDVDVDPLFRYALRNVIVNSAMHAASPAVDVEIKTTRDRLGTCKIEVSDNGPGIHDDLKSAVFRREGRKEDGGGLSLVKRIVSRYGGRVWIEDRVPGNPSKGTRVVITLPPKRHDHQRWS